MVVSVLGAALLAGGAEGLAPTRSSLQAAAVSKLLPRTPSNPFIVDSQADVAGLGEELAIVERATDYEEFFSIRRTWGSEPFLVARGSAEDWSDLCRTLSDVEVFDPRAQGSDECSWQEEHDVVTHFAARMEKTRIEELAAARDYVASRTCGRSVVACALVSQPEDCVDPMPTSLKDKAREYGVVVLFGRTLGAVVSLAQVEADLKTAQADLTAATADRDTALDNLAAMNETIKTLGTDLATASDAIASKDAVLTEVAGAIDDPDLLQRVKDALGAGN